MSDSRVLFRPCLGKTACTEGGTHCRACGRSFDEIERTRILVQGLTDLVLEMDYDNLAEFADYVARRIVKKIAHAREQEVSAA
jgi:hypothetical protein